MLEGLDVRHDKNCRAWTRVSPANLSLRDEKGRCLFRTMHPRTGERRLAVMCAGLNCVAMIDTDAKVGENISFVTTCGHRTKEEVFCFEAEKICASCMEIAATEESPMRRISAEAA